jgi:hypothetical protein
MYEPSSVRRHNSIMPFWRRVLKEVEYCCERSSKDAGRACPAPAFLDSVDMAIPA